MQTPIDVNAAHVHEPNAPRALVAQLATAVRFLTVLPVRGATAPLGESAVFFPLVGVGIGALLVTVDRVLVGSPDPVQNFVVIALLALVTGGRHLAAVARTARRLAGGGAAAGGLALVLAIGAKLGALSMVAPPLRATALVLAPLLSRWSLVVMAYGSRRRPGAAATPLLGSMTFREFALASVSALAIALVAADAWALAAILVVAGVTVVVRLVAHRTAGGIDADLAGAIVEIDEALVLTLMWIVGASARMVAAP